MRTQFRLGSCFAALVLTANAVPAQVWQAVGPFPASDSPRQLATALNQNGSLWIIGGTPLDTSGNGRVHKYFAATNTVAASAMPLEGGAQNGGVALDALGRILVFSGVDSGGAEGDYYSWTETDGNNGGFATRSSQAPKTYFALATDDSGRIYSIGGGPGASATTGNPNKNRVECYDAMSDAWQVRAPLPTAVADAGAVFDGNGHILVIGGFGATGARTANVARYDIANDTWSDTEIGDLPMALSGARAVLGVDNRVYVIGGTNGTTQRSTWILDDGATTWRPGPNLGVPRHRAACVLGTDDFIYVFGGSNDSGGTGTNEKLFTPRCPRVEIEATPLAAILGEPVGLSISVLGTAPFTYRWRHDGIDLIDGLQGSGTIVSGATTASLGILQTRNSDAGSYDCVISNSCGTTTSAAVTVTLRQAPTLPATFGARSLHPSGALSSRANAVDGGSIAGEGLYPTPGYNPQYHPLTWNDQGVSTDLTPGNSVGGSVQAMRAGTKVGWYWWPYWTQFGTGYYQHACAWNASNVIVDLQPQGFETGLIANTDGVHHVGWAFYDVDHSIAVDGVYWPSSTPFTYVMLTAGGNFGTSGANMGALDGGRLFGTLFGVTPYDATMWRQDSGNAWRTTNVAPLNSYGSFIQDAESGVQAGRATIAGKTQAGLWGGTSNAFVLLTPNGATSAEAVATRAGLQAGFAYFSPTAGHAFVWRGTAASALDLHPFSPLGFTTDSATDIDVDDFGTVRIVGYGSNSITGRTEALEWRGNPRALSTEAETLSATNGCSVRFTLFGGPQHAGKQWKLAAFAARSLTPGTHNVQLAPIRGSFDALGFAGAQIDVPAGAVSAPVKLTARFSVYDAGGGVVLSSNVAVVAIAP